MKLCWLLSARGKIHFRMPVIEQNEFDWPFTLAFSAQVFEFEKSDPKYEPWTCILKRWVSQWTLLALSRRKGKRRNCSDNVWRFNASGSGFPAGIWKFVCRKWRNHSVYFQKMVDVVHQHGATLISGNSQNIICNPGGNFKLFRLGNAVASRNINSAIFDSLRLCKDL